MRLIILLIVVVVTLMGTIIALAVGVAVMIITIISAPFRAIIRQIKGSDKKPKRKQPSYVTLSEISDQDYVGNIKTGVFHRYDCRQAPQISHGNEVWFESVADASLEDYTPCKLCNPE